MSCLEAIRTHCGMSGERKSGVVESLIPDYEVL